MNVYTEYMLASLFNVTTTSPFECNLKNPVPVKGRKSYRKIQWNMLTDNEKTCIQEALGI